MYSNLDFSEIPRSLIGIFNIIVNINYIILGVLFIIITMMFFSYRLMVIVNKFKQNGNTETKNNLIVEEKKLKYCDALFFIVIGGIINIGGFSKLGIPAKALLLRKHGYSTKISLASMTVDTTFDIIFYILVIAMVLLYLPSLNITDFFNLNLILIAIFIIILLILVLFIKFSKFSDLFIRFINNIKSFDYSTILKMFILTLSSWLLLSISYYFIIISTNEDLNIFTTIIIFSISTVIGMLSPLGGGLGVKEGLLVFFSTQMHIDPSKALFIAVIHRILILLVLLFILTLLKLNNHQKTKNIIKT